MSSVVFGPNWEQFVEKATAAGMTKESMSLVADDAARTKMLKAYNVHPSRLDDYLKKWVEIYPPPPKSVVDAAVKAKECGCRREFGAPIVHEFEAGKKILVLPQQETRHNWYRRVQDLDLMKLEYQFDFYPGNIAPPYCREIPEREISCATKEHNSSMVFDIVESTVKLGLNKIKDSIGDFFRRENCAFEDYYDLYNKDQSKQPALPPVSQRWREDAEFARQRLQGAHPIMIEGLFDALPPNFPLKDSDIEGIVEKGATIKSLLAEKRLFIVNYKCVEGVAQIAPKENFFVEPIMLFFVNKDRVLMPLAIQLFQDPSKGPIFTPKDDADGKNLWLIAKLHCQCTDACWHEVPSHLLSCHLVMESVYVAMMRTVSTRHPINELVSAHFWYTLKINAAARTNLMAPGTVVPKVMSMGYNGMVELLTRGWKNFSFDVYNVPAEVKKRRVDDAKLLPGYYFRDDGVQVWEAIHRYVSRVIDHFYPGGDCDVQKDIEIQAWVAELLHPDRVGAKGTPFVKGTCATLDELKLFVTEVIWASSAYHAVLNNSQYGYWGFVPNCPATLRLPPPTSKTQKFSEKDIAGAMPTYGYASEQIAFLHLLSMPTDQPLGDFKHKPDYMQGHETVLRALGTFRDELSALSQSIRARNAKIPVAYENLDPVQIANGIAI